jgi:hypothetical protein
MKCRRFLLRRKFVPFLEGRLPIREAKRLEKHLVACERCRTLFKQSQAGHQLAQELQQLDPDARRAPEYRAIKTDIGKQASGFRKWVRIWENGLYALMTTRGVKILLVLVLALAVVLAVSNWKIIFRERSNIPVHTSALDFSDFHPVSIAELGSNTRPHIMTEGYVRDVYVDTQEGTLHFKLAESAQGSGPFVVCEIISPVGMTLPREGNRVRVYGVARYDSQPGRMWCEINPVLNIALLKR